MKLIVRSVAAAAAFLAQTALAETVTLSDPKGDDNGPGSYTYPTDSVYKPGSFDMTEATVEDTGSDIVVSVSFAAALEDPWNSKSWEGNGFSLQMAFVFLDLDHKAGSGQKDGVPGLNIKFAEDSRWEKCLLISPQGSRRLQSEIASKAKSMQKDLVLPKKVRVQGRKIVATFDKADVGAIGKGTGYQVAIQSNEGYPAKSDLLTRPVNEVKGQHRFGGGHDFNCDPHVIDMLAGKAAGGADEKDAQHAALKGYVCDDNNEDGGKRVEIQMVYP